MRSFNATGLGLTVAATLAAMFATAAAAQEKFPSRPIQIVVPFEPGGGLDLHARALTPVMERTLKQPMVVVYKPGAGGAVGLQFVAKGKADGYTLVMGLPSITILPEVDRLLGRPQAFTREMFAPIALLSTEPLILVVQDGSPWKSVADLVADARRRPGVILASSGPYSPAALATEMFTHAAGIRLTHVPQAGAGPSLLALLGGHTQLYFSPPPPAVGHLRKGTLRALAVTSANRHPRFPDVPTLKQLGFDVEFYNWYGVFAPRATPPEALKVLRDTTSEAMKDPHVVAAMAKLETPITYLGADEFEKFLERDAKSLIEAVRRIGRMD